VIQHIRPSQVRKGDLIILPEKKHKVIQHAKQTSPGVWDIETPSQMLRITDDSLTMRVDVWFPRAVRNKIGEASYNIVETESGTVLGHTVRTGRPGVDNYPWNWSVDFKTVDGSRTIGSADTLRAAFEYIINAVRNRIDR